MLKDDYDANDAVGCLVGWLDNMRPHVVVLERNNLIFLFNIIGGVEQQRLSGNLLLMLA